MLIPLYRAIYDKYRGYTLPPEDALEKEIVTLGAPPKQAQRARIAFERSARQAGFFEQGNNRLIIPAFRDTEPETVPLDESEPKSSGHGGGDEDRHPFIQGLLKTLPEPGTDWSIQDRVEWLQAAAQIFKIIYEGADGKISVNHECSNEPRQARTHERKEIHPRPITGD